MIGAAWTISSIPLSDEVNMKKLFLLVIVVLLSGCTKSFNPPSAEDADLFLKINRDDIDTIVQYLHVIETDDDSVFIDGTDYAFYEFEDHKILSDEVKASLRHLKSNGCEDISMQKDDNTICFEIWSRTMGNVGCGIACTLDGHGFPKVQFQTACKPISDGWFYYYTDYEAYRINPSKYDEMWENQN